MNLTKIESIARKTKYAGYSYARTLLAKSKKEG